MPKTKQTGNGPVIDAISNHDIEALQKLLANGADANAKLNSKPHGNAGVLAYAAGCQFIGGVECLLKAGADVNFCSSNHPGGSGRTALYEAVVGVDARPANSTNHSTEADRLKLVEILLRAGADPNLVGEGDCLPLSAAARTARFEICKKLIEAGATYKTWPEKCSAPLSEVAGGGAHNDAGRLAEQEEIARMLLKLGAPLDADKDGFTPLMAAAIKGSEALVNLFLDHGAKVNLQENKYGRTPLICAALFYRWDGHNEEKQQTGLRIIKRLLQSGSDASIRNTKGENAFEVVARCANPAAANLIKEYMSV